MFRDRERDRDERGGVLMLIFYISSSAGVWGEIVYGALALFLGTVRLDIDGHGGHVRLRCRRGRRVSLEDAGIVQRRWGVADS